MKEQQKGKNLNNIFKQKWTKKEGKGNKKEKEKEKGEEKNKDRHIISDLVHRRKTKRNLPDSLFFQ